ncbi:MAG: UDP-3-O-(3-hydroxymyristoyl)glucosamine N-acyltransferase [Candidatus Omnitrophota bacterium]
MGRTLKEIAVLVGGEIQGDPALLITGVAGLKEAGPGDISFLSNSRYTALLKTTGAGAVIVPRDIASCEKPVIRVDDPSLAFAKAARVLLNAQVRHPKGIHKTAVIAESAKIGRDVAIGAYAVIEEGASIGDRTVIYAGCFIGHDTTVGEDCIFYAHVSVRERVTIGNRVFIQSGSVIGSEGFGYAKVDGAYQLIPQAGSVLIEDDVEIGANVTVDRARFDKTKIGRGTKIDNLVQIAHNVEIGENSIIVAQAGISGSTHIGNRVTIAGQAGIVGHVEIGDGAILTAQSGIMNNVPAESMVTGYPARPHAEALKIWAVTGRLPELLKTVQELKKKLSAIEEQLKKQG